jgi:hypothetical protein
MVASSAQELGDLKVQPTDRRYAMSLIGPKGLCRSMASRQLSKVLRTKCGLRQRLIAVPRLRPSAQSLEDHSIGP